VAISQELEKLGVGYIGVGFLEEGIALREAGIKSSILVLGGVAGFQIDYFLEYDLELTASSHFILQDMDRRARRMNRRAKVHLKIDTGLNRIGVNYRRAPEFLQFASTLPGIEVKGIYSHLALADSDLEFTKLQYQRLVNLREPSKKLFGDKIFFHLLNSAGIINFPQGAMEFVRPGLMLYGLIPNISYIEKVKLEPSLSLKSEVVFIKRVTAGEGISYGHTFSTQKETNIVTIPIGYGDGYPNRMSNKGEVLIGGKRYPVVGRVCMDQIMVDVGDDRIRVGEEVVLIGRQGYERITVEEISELTGAVPYEITIGITNRVPRLYLNR
jgi:alanine racemase